MTKSERGGKYMHTSSGQKYWPMDPRPNEVVLETIAHHLATRCRWNGATQHRYDLNKIFYSVAEHAVLCSLYGPKETALERLHHDSSEAYNGDLIRPLKYDPAFAAPFKLVEERNELVIAQRFGLQFPFPADVKIADEAVCAAEAQQIIIRDPNDEWESGKLHDDRVVAPFEIQMWLPHVAKRKFLERHYELMAEREERRTHQALRAL